MRSSLAANLRCVFESIEGRLFLSAAGWHGGTPPIQGDFTGDGNTDLLVTRNGGWGLSILPGDGTGHFGAPINVTNARVAQVLAADFTGDGKLDLLIQSPHKHSTWQLLPGNGDGTFATAVAVTGAPTKSPLFVGDFNGDSMADLAVPAFNRSQPRGAVNILFGDGKGGFAAPLQQPTGVFFSQVAAVADFNADNKDDLLIRQSRFDGGGLMVLQSNGDGTFANGPIIAAAPVAPVVAVADFNGDGTPDVLLHGRVSSPSPSAVRVFARSRGKGNHFGWINVKDQKHGRGPKASPFSLILSNSTGGFDAPVATTGVPKSGPAAVGDFNNDGKADLVDITHGRHGTVQVLLGDGLGNFTPAP